DKAEAQERAKAVLRSIRFGNNDYIFVYAPDGTNLVLGPLPELEGKDLTGLKDADGIFYVRDLIAAGRRGGGYVAYKFPRAGSDQPAPKLAYALGVEPWDWVIGTGVYVDDLDALFRERLRAGLLWSVGLIAVLVLCAVPLARGLIRPVRAMTTAMGRLADGDVTTEIPALDRGDEIGAMAR